MKNRSLFPINIFYLFLLIFFLFTARCFTQQDNTSMHRIHKNLIYINANNLFNLLGYNFNVEKELFTYNRGTINIRIGCGQFYHKDYEATQVLANWVYLMGRKRNHLEIDMGITSYIDNNMKDTSESDFSKDFFARVRFVHLINIGYRYHDPYKHFMFRTGVGTELIYIGVGFSF